MGPDGGREGRRPSRIGGVIDDDPPRTPSRGVGLAVGWAITIVGMAVMLYLLWV